MAIPNERPTRAGGVNGEISRCEALTSRGPTSLNGLVNKISSGTTSEELPATARALVEVIGLQGTIDLVKACGGDEIKVPAMVDSDSRAWTFLEKAIGRDAAAKLVNSWFRGTPVYVPMCAAAIRAERTRDIIRRIDAGEDLDSVRLIHGISRSYLYRLLRKRRTRAV